MKFNGYILKRRIEDILMSPFILVGRILAKFEPLKKEYRIFFFFPFYHTGGAEKVHAQITKAIGSNDCIIFFTRRSVDQNFLDAFKSSGCELRDISSSVDITILYFLKFIWRGKISSYINNQKNKPVVFNGQSNFGYKISPWIRKDIKQIELIHSFNSFSRIRLPFLPFITKTIMISKLRIEEHIKQYKKLEVPAEYTERLHFIQNAIELPKNECPKILQGPLKLLFVGRGTREKRPGLFIKLATWNPYSEFTLAGEMDEKILQDLPQNLNAIGNISDPGKLHEIYCQHHILIIPSTTEGFPIVLMEAMARGCAVMATPVGDIPYHINNENGFLFSSTDEDAIINEAVKWLQQLTPARLQALSASAKDYAFKNFGIATFNQQYKAILQS